MIRFVFPAACAALAAFFSAPASAEMILTSPDIAEGATLPEAQILDGFGCSGGDAAPALSWSGAPEGTKSFVLTAYDPDAPTGSGFWHWVVFDIPGETTGLPEGGALPAGAVAARNDFSRNAYGGACPPEGETHRYVFTLFAMPQQRLPLDETASGAMVGFFAHTGALAKASITAVYGR